MKKLMLNVLAATAVLVLFFAYGHTQKRGGGGHNNERNDWFNHNGHASPGTWLAYIEKDLVFFDLTGFNWSNTRTFTRAEVGTVPVNAEGEFKITREAGTITFTGRFDGNKGQGTYKFAENTAFRDYLTQQGYSGITEALMLQVYLTGIDKNYFAVLKANGYTNITNTQFKDLAEQQVSLDVLQGYFGLFKKEGYTNVGLNKIIELREHGVDADFVESFHAAGYGEVPLDRALQLRDHGVDTEYINSFRTAGYKDKITLERAQELRDHGVDPDFIKELTDAGYKDISLGQALNMRDHGVGADYIKELNDAGFKNISLEKAQELRDHGVSADFIRELKDAGVKILPPKKRCTLGILVLAAII